MHFRPQLPRKELQQQLKIRLGPRELIVLKPREIPIRNLRIKLRVAQFQQSLVHGLREVSDVPRQVRLGHEKASVFDPRGRRRQRFVRHVESVFPAEACALLPRGDLLCLEG